MFCAIIVKLRRTIDVLSSIVQVSSEVAIIVRVSSLYLLHNEDKTIGHCTCLKEISGPLSCQCRVNGLWQGNACWAWIGSALGSSRTRFLLNDIRDVPFAGVSVQV